MRIQINDQGKEFVNEVITDLHEMTGVDQRITSAYHSQSNGLCESQNRNIKESLVKVLNAKPSEWPYVIEGVLFAHRVSKHSSTKFSLFFLMYNIHPVLPVDIEYSLNGTDETSVNDQPFNMEVFNAMLSSTLSLRNEAHQEASKNIAKAQEKQQKDYNRRNTVPASLKIKDKVWLKNQRRQDRKGGKFSSKWTGPYTIEHITKKGLCTLKNERSTVLAKKFNVGLLKPYVDALAVDPQDEEKPHAVPPDEKPASTQSEKCIQNKANEWRHLPDEIVDMILALAVESSKEPVSTFNHLSLTCSRFNTTFKKKVTICFPMSISNSLRKNTKS